jgi:flagellar P-ring protein precursor FlgI
MVVPDAKARVIINEQTGTVVIGENVRLSRVAVTHANISVVTGETPEVSQPLPFSDGQTRIVPRTNIDVLEERSPVTVIEETTSVADLAQALNALGVTPQDLSSIFRLLHESGELHAELIFK